MDGAARSANPAPGAEEHERGFVVIWMAIVLFLLLAIAALAVDLVHAYAEAQHLQNAVDAAALAGAAERRATSARRRCPFPTRATCSRKTASTRVAKTTT
jgi:Flp pilus assembly protein TadG